MRPGWSGPWPAFTPKEKALEQDGRSGTPAQLVNQWALLLGNQAAPYCVTSGLPNASFLRENATRLPGGCKPGMEDSKGPEEEEGEAHAIQLW